MEETGKYIEERIKEHSCRDKQFARTKTSAERNAEISGKGGGGGGNVDL